MEKKDSIIIFSRLEKSIFWVLVIFAIISPLIFKWTALFEFLSIEESPALIGDAIGGISSPFIGLLAAFLVYKSFEAQIIANRDQMSLIRDSHKDQMEVITQEMNYNFLSNLIEECLESFKTLRIMSFDDREYVYGRDCMRSVINYLYTIEENSPIVTPFMEKLNSRIKSLDLVVDELNKSKLNKEIKFVKKRHIYTFIYEFLEDYTEELYYVGDKGSGINQWIDKCNDEIFEKYKSLKEKLKE